jgi:predicted kinase
MPKATLVVVSGPPGSGKTTLAHALAGAIPCLAVCRDEIKEGMVHAVGGDFEPAHGDPLTQRTFTTFFDVLRVLVEAEVSVVAEAAFQDRLWRHGLEPLSELAQLRIVHCTPDPTVAWERLPQRLAPRPAHHVGAHVHDLELWKRDWDAFERVSIPAPSLVVDTTDGYSPDVAEIVEFVSRR